MVIVIIHWKIKEGPEYRAAFLRYWKETLRIEDRSHLVGEYLSRPLSPEETDFDVTVLDVPESAPYQSFFNVGIWDSVESLKEQIIDPYVGFNPEPKDFEHEYRSRMILSPTSWRQGLAPFPSIDQFE